jgi:hypothetical protein
MGAETIGLMALALNAKFNYPQYFVRNGEAIGNILCVSESLRVVDEP